VKQRAAALRADHVAPRIDANAVGRPREHDVVIRGIDEDVGDPFEPAEKQDVGRKRGLARDRTLDRGDDPGQRNLPQVARLNLGDAR
jgi:hypothetical protein